MNLTHKNGIWRGMGKDQYAESTTSAGVRELMDGYKAGTEHPNSQLAPYRLTIGDRVKVQGLSGVFEVLSTDDPSLVTLKVGNGTTLKAGWRTLRRADV